MHENSTLQKLLINQELSQEEVVEVAEDLLSSDDSAINTPEILCQAAQLLFRYGLLKQEGPPLLVALDKLMRAEELNPDLDPHWRHLWGNILAHLSRLIHDYSFVEKALHQYARAAKTEESPRLLWDWAQAWLLLGVHSAELADIKQGLEKFALAAQSGCDAPHFRIDYAIARMILGLHTGDPSPIEGGIASLREVIAETYQADEGAHARAWTTYAILCKQRYCLTHLHTHFQEADVALREAILAIPAEADLWLEWGELYLHAGWLRHDMRAIETGLDKLTSSKIKEGDPLRAAALLGKGLVCLGLYLEDLKLMYDAKERILSALEIAPKHPLLLSARGLSELVFGIYFSDSKAFAKATLDFEKEIENDSASVRDWHGLFLTSVSWGVSTEDPSLVRKGIQAITRLCNLRPYSPIHWNEWGVSLLQLKQLESDTAICQALVEEAILKFKHAYTLNDDAEILYNWGCALDQLGDLSGEEEDYERAIELLSQLHEVSPSEPHVRYHLALALSHLGELVGDVESLEQAIMLFRPLVEADPEDGTLWGDFGYTLLNLSELVYDPIHPDRGEGLKREAERRLLHAAESGNGESNYHLACLYSLAGLLEASIRFLKRAESAGALPPQEDLQHDEWLANVRNSDLFREFIW